MSLFIGGAQISLILTILSMIASTGGVNSEYFYVNTTLTSEEQKDERAAQRNLLVWSMLCKVYVVQFLKNNQEVCLPVPSLLCDSFSHIVLCLCCSSGPGQLRPSSRLRKTFIHSTSCAAPLRAAGQGNTPQGGREGHRGRRKRREAKQVCGVIRLGSQKKRTEAKPFSCDNRIHERN